MRVQSPVISSALRERLGLDGSGSFPMEAGDVIVPVAIVASVADELTTNIVPAWQAVYAAAVAAQYSYCALTWPSGALAQVTERLHVRRLTLNSPTAQRVYVGLTTALAVTLGFQSPRRKIGSLQSSNLAGQGGSGSNAVAPGAFLPNVGKIVYCPANIDVTLDFPDGVIIDNVNGALCAINNVVNSDLYASFEWDEYRRP